MPSYMTSDTLIASVKRRASIPENQNTFTEDDFLAFANEELKIGLVPSILRLREDYYLYTQETSLVENQQEYDIPARAIGNKLRDLFYKDTAGNIFEMTRVDIEHLSDWENTSFETSRIYGYYIKNNQIVLISNIGSNVSGSLMFVYYLRPNELVSHDRVARVTAINTTTGEVDVTQVPDIFNTMETYDFIETKSPHRTLQIEVTASSVNSNTNKITFDPSILNKLSVGDYICLAEETYLVQAPSDLHVVLAHRTSNRCLESLGDTEGLSNASKKLAEMEDRLTNLVDNRVEGSPKIIVNRNTNLRDGLNKRRYKHRG